MKPWGQSVIEYALLFAAIALVTGFASTFIRTAQTAANTARDTAVQRLTEPAPSGASR